MIFIERLRLDAFRNYRTLDLKFQPLPVVLTGQNGSGKTNLLEAISLLSQGQGLRRAGYDEMGQAGSPAWSVSAVLHSANGTVTIGTGLGAAKSEAARNRLVRIDGEPKSAASLADHVEVMWLTPAMDGLFTGPASERRRFLDRMIQCFDPGYRLRLNHFERAVRQRNKLLEQDRARPAELAGLETLVAETGVAIAAARVEAVAALKATIEARRTAVPGNPFPWAGLALEGMLETELAANTSALDVEDRYRRALAEGRPRDRAAGRTLAGPHRSDLVVAHGPKAMPARLSSTGEQKALLLSLLLAHAEHVRRQKPAGSPILLLDEIAAHLDEFRRAALFSEVLEQGAQVFLTGTDRAPFEALENRAQFLSVVDGKVSG